MPISHHETRLAAPLRWVIVTVALLGLAAASVPTAIAGPPATTGTFRNPLEATIPGQDGVVENCPDPSIISGHDQGDPHWYVYCTTDPLNGDDRDDDGDLNFRLMPILRSADLVDWTYVGDVFEERPDWVAATAGLWAPEIVHRDGTYYLYYSASATSPELGGHSAIGVATAPTPTGPWTDSGEPAVEPRPDRETIDPAVLEADGTSYLYFGSYFGGLWVRELTEDGLGTVDATETRVAIANRYEAPFVVERDGAWYLFASATDCCRGELTGYTVFVGRADHPTGPFVDRDGVSFLDGRVGGTPVLSANGNRWVGPGHNAVFTDHDGQDWFLYHAIDRDDPYFAGAPGFTRRPLMLDGLDWVDGWPTVRGGRGPSDTPQHAPAAQPGEITRHRVQMLLPDAVGTMLPEHSDDFSGEVLDPAWEWVREAPADTWAVEDGVLRFDTQAADLHEQSNNASVLTRPAPEGNYVVEARVRVDLPPEGCCQNFTQAGLVIYLDDDEYLKLVHVSIWETRQTEFAKETVLDGAPRYGNTVVGPPGEWTDLRIVKRTVHGEEHYTAYTRGDGGAWVRGGTWTHDLGADARIGLVSMGGSGFTAEFDTVSVHELNRGRAAR